MGQFQEVLDPRPRRVGDHFRGKRMFVFPAECCKLGLVLEICDIHKGKVAPTFPFLHWPLSCGRKCAVWFCDDEGQRLGQGWHANYCIQLVTSSITYVLVGWENIRLMCKRKTVTVLSRWRKCLTWRAVCVHRFLDASIKTVWLCVDAFGRKNRKHFVLSQNQMQTEKSLPCVPTGQS